MGRRVFSQVIACLIPGLGRAFASSLSGRLLPRVPPALLTSDGEVVLDGDLPSLAVLGDPRLRDVSVEVRGSRLADGRFKVGPIHTRSIVVLKENRRWAVTYWCDTCSIRTYSPGTCACCQEETVLDLQPAE